MGDAKRQENAKRWGCENAGECEKVGKCENEGECENAENGRKAAKFVRALDRGISRAIICEPEYMFEKRDLEQRRPEAEIEENHGSFCLTFQIQADRRPASGH